MPNQSGLSPRGRAVLVKPYEPEIKKGLIAIPDNVQERNQMVEQRAVVIEVGPEAWVDERQPRAEVGDKVLISKFAGHMAIGPADGERYRFINERDIFGVITKEQGNA